ncbi:MAG: hypothetical protein IKW01_01145, partial [Firmicutes bacterium]|nr:hypothetical protein [Bacillota bacterium]
HQFMGTYDQMDQLRFLDKIDAANKAYDDAHRKYKEHKKEFAEKYKDIDLKGLSEKFKENTKDLNDKISKHKELGKEIDQIPKQEAEVEKESDNWYQKLNDAQDGLSAARKRLDAYNHYLYRYGQKTEKSMGRRDELKQQIKAQDLKVTKVMQVKNETVEAFNKISEKLEKALEEYKDNADAKFYIQQQMKNIEHSVLFECLTDINERAPTGTVSILPAHIKMMLDKTLTKEGPEGSLGINGDEPIKDMLAAVMNEMGKVYSETVMEALQNESVEAALSEYKQKALDLLTFDKEFRIETVQLQNLQKRLDINKTQIDADIDEVRKYNRLEIIPDEHIRERLFNLEPEAFIEELIRLKELEEYDIKIREKHVNESKEGVRKAEEKKTKLEQRRRQLINEKAKYWKEIEPLSARYEHEKAALNDLKTLHEEYVENNRARTEAVKTYEENKNKIDQQELFTMQTAASAFYDRVNDAAKGHTNSTEFEKMSEALKEVTELNGKSRDEKTAKLQVLKERIKEYQDAKEAQRRWRWIPTNLRKTRLAFADELAKWTDESLKKMEKGSAQHLKQLNETYNTLSEKEKTKSKPKEMDAFTASLDDKIKKANAPMKEEVPENVNENGMEMGSK